MAVGYMKIQQYGASPQIMMTAARKMIAGY